MQAKPQSLYGPLVEGTVNWHTWLTTVLVAKLHRYDVLRHRMGSNPRSCGPVSLKTRYHWVMALSQVCTASIQVACGRNLYLLIPSQFHNSSVQLDSLLLGARFGHLLAVVAPGVLIGCMPLANVGNIRMACVLL